MCWLIKCGWSLKIISELGGCERSWHTECLPQRRVQVLRVEEWRGLHKRVYPLTGCRRRNLSRAIMAPQRVKMEDLGAALQTLEEMVARYNKKTANVEAVELADGIKCSAVESMVLENLERHLQLNARRLKKYDKIVRPRT